MRIQFIKNVVVNSFAKCYVLPDMISLNEINLNEFEKSYVSKNLHENKTVILNRYNELLIIIIVDSTTIKGSILEYCRIAGNELNAILTKEKIKEVTIKSFSPANKYGLLIAEGCALGGYQFSIHKSEKLRKDSYPEKIIFADSWISLTEIDDLAATIESVFWARDLINEPFSHLNAAKLAESFELIGNKANFSTKILYKPDIEVSKMGGLLAVNQGSIDPPTFSVLEWKPENSFNKHPIVLIGKGVVYDTGGLSLKPTKDSMDYMKCDMAGGATVAAAIKYSVQVHLPLHLIALIPATDNRPSGNAITPGDIITMHNGMTVEVMNTDAEGRLLLADALSYAQQYKPCLVIDVATLTGSAAMAIGQQGIVAMGNFKKELFNLLKASGEKVHERIVEFPLWDEYEESIRSDIADMKNVGSREAGAITAGKFLQKFVNYPWVHLDIAGPAFINSRDHYRSKGGTAFGVRLLIEFLKSFHDQDLD